MSGISQIHCRTSRRKLCILRGLPTDIFPFQNHHNSDRDVQVKVKTRMSDIWILNVADDHQKIDWITMSMQLIPTNQIRSISFRFRLSKFHLHQSRRHMGLYMSLQLCQTKSKQFLRSTKTKSKHWPL